MFEIGADFVTNNVLSDRTFNDLDLLIIENGEYVDNRLSMKLILSILIPSCVVIILLIYFIICLIIKEKRRLYEKTAVESILCEILQE